MEFNEEHIFLLIELSELNGHKYIGINFCLVCQKETKWNAVYSRKCSECSFCGKQYYPMAGTIFEKTRIPLSKWHKAFVFILKQEKTNISELKDLLSVTYKTAWRIYWRVKASINFKSVEYELLINRE